MAEAGAGVKPGMVRSCMAAIPPGAYDGGMTTDSDARAERLAAALRDNLRRRKAQARAVAATAPATAPARSEDDAMRAPDGPGSPS